MFAAQLHERSRRGAEYEKAGSSTQRLESAHQVHRRLHRVVERSTADDGIYERDERWIPHATAKREFLLEERGVVLPARELNAVVIGIERLHDRFAGALAAAGAPRDLRQELERTL